jgi:hypothetical protein
VWKAQECGYHLFSISPNVLFSMFFFCALLCCCRCVGGDVIGIDLSDGDSRLCFLGIAVVCMYISLLPIE